MSRSKEGFQSDENFESTQQGNESAENRTNLDERLGARGQTDYTGGRESYPDFPKRSRSTLGRSETESESRQTSGSSKYGRRGGLDYESRGATGARNLSSGASRYGSRTESGNVNPRDYSSRTGFDERSRYGSFGQTGRPETQNRYSAGRSEDESRYGRHSYDDLRSGRADHEDFGRSSGRYRANEQRDYDTGRAGFASDRSSYTDRGSYSERDSYSDRGSYGDPYNREALSGRYENTERDYDSAVGYRDYEARDEDYDARSDWRGRGRERGRERNMLRCSDIMTKDVTTCSPLTPIREVADKMEDENVGIMPVVENNRLVGIVTDRDIVCRVLAEGRDTRTTPASEAMSEDIVTCTPDDSINEAIRKMGEHQVRRIAICDMNGRLRGIISMADVALEAEQDRELAQAIERISQPTPNRSRRV